MITAMFNLFLTPGEALIHVWKITITKEGVTAAVRMMIRLTYLVLGTSLMTLTTTPNQLTDGLERALKPLGRLHVPVHEIAMMMSIDPTGKGNDPAVSSSVCVCLPACE